MKKISELIEVLQNYHKKYGDIYLSYDLHEDDGHQVDDDFVSDFDIVKPYKINPTLFYDRKLAQEHSDELVLSLSALCYM